MQVLLYQHYLVFCKTVSQRTRTSYHFKLCLALASLGMSSILRGPGLDRVIELRIAGQSEVYRLQAKNKKVKEEFAAELRQAIVRAKEQSETHQSLHFTAEFN